MIIRKVFYNLIIKNRAKRGDVLSQYKITINVPLGTERSETILPRIVLSTHRHQQHPILLHHLKYLFWHLSFYPLL